MISVRNFLKNIHKNRKSPVWGGVFILLTITIVIFLESFFSARNPANKDVLPTRQVMGDYTPSISELYGGDQETVYSRSGQVVNIGKQAVYFESEFIENSQIIKAIFKAEISDATKILKRDFTAYLAAGPEAEENTGATNISLKEIQPGDTIMIISAENIKNKNIFPVTKLVVQYYSE